MTPFNLKAPSQKNTLPLERALSLKKNSSSENALSLKTLFPPENAPYLESRIRSLSNCFPALS